jgi:hypothetical protein
VPFIVEQKMSFSSWYEVCPDRQELVQVLLPVLKGRTEEDVKRIVDMVYDTDTARANPHQQQVLAHGEED